MRLAIRHRPRQLRRLLSLREQLLTLLVQEQKRGLRANASTETSAHRRATSARARASQSPNPHHIPPHSRLSSLSHIATIPSHARDRSHGFYFFVFPQVSHRPSPSRRRSSSFDALPSFAHRRRSAPSPSPVRSPRDVHALSVFRARARTHAPNRSSSAACRVPGRRARPRTSIVRSSAPSRATTGATPLDRGRGRRRGRSDRPTDQ